MIPHPLSIAVTTADTAALFLLIAGAWTALQVVTRWRPGVADREQIALEIRAETASIRVAMALGILVFSSLILVAAIALVLPGVVAGAMCGTGVLQAAGGDGWRALLFRLAGCAVLYQWWVLEGLNRTRPESPLTRQAGRMLLAAVPLIVPGLADTAIALAGLGQPQAPVACCTVVVDRAVAAGLSGQADGWLDAAAIACFTIAGVLLAATALRLGLGKGAPSPATVRLFTVLSLAWIPAAAVVVVRYLAAYHFQVLFHRCPWCLFLPDHAMVGFPIFGALCVVAVEGPAGSVALAAGSRVPVLSDAAQQRVHRAGRRVSAALAVFVLFALVPPLVWRLRWGVWL